MLGVITVLEFYPTENLAVVVLTNGNEGWRTIGEDSAAVMLPRLADSLKVERAKKQEPKPAAFAERHQAAHPHLRTGQRRRRAARRARQGRLRAPAGQAASYPAQFGDVHQ